MTPCRLTCRMRDSRGETGGLGQIVPRRPRRLGPMPRLRALRHRAPSTELIFDIGQTNWTSTSFCPC
eukprot:scaffold121295_cov59-Phaeocystis_antarctica.AAC.3